MKKLVMLFSLLSLMGTALSASECEYEAKELTIGWEAYKTAAKIGVKGGFDTIELSSDESKSVTELLESLKAEIATGSVNSGNAGRDKTLVESFFKLFLSDTIQTEVVGLKGDETAGVMTVSMRMNGMSKMVPLTYQVRDGMLEAKGYVDLFDFDLSKALGSINKACYDLHGGKTWSDVALRATLKIKKECE